jgi:hypothetical protein
MRKEPIAAGRTTLILFPLSEHSGRGWMTPSRHQQADIAVLHNAVTAW